MTDYAGAAARRAFDPSPTAAPTGARRRRFVASIWTGVGGAAQRGNDFHLRLYDWGHDAAVFDEMLALHPRGVAWKARRLSWNLGEIVLGNRAGGFQYSVGFLERAWRPVASKIRGGVVVNCFPLYPPSLVDSDAVARWYFLDQTLRQNLEGYGLTGLLSERTVAAAYREERRGYQRAEGIIVHSDWAARSVVEDYGVGADRLHVVVPGANFDSTAYARWELEAAEKRVVAPRGADRPLRLVFAGKDWRRKGLDILIQAVSRARAAGAKIELRVLGCDQRHLPRGIRRADGVEWVGFFDKFRDPTGFLRILADNDIGCLLSRAEAGGIVLREFNAVGLACLITNVGGAAQHAPAGGSVILDHPAAAEDVAHVLVNLAEDRARVESLKLASWESRRRALWPAAIEEIHGLLSSADKARDDTGAMVR